jgi:hypothetical protein
MEREHSVEYYEGEKYTITLPTKFYDDHESRELPSGVEVKRDKKGVTIEANWATICEIWSDAEYYYDMFRTGGFDYVDLGLMSSARATIKRIKKFKIENYDLQENVIA